MVVVSVPKALDRVKKSLECFGQSKDCLCDLRDVCYYHEKITCLCDVVGGSRMNGRIFALAHVS